MGVRSLTWLEIASSFSSRFARAYLITFTTSTQGFNRLLGRLNEFENMLQNEVVGLDLRQLRLGPLVFFFLGLSSVSGLRLIRVWGLSSWTQSYIWALHLEVLIDFDLGLNRPCYSSPTKSLLGFRAFVINFRHSFLSGPYQAFSLGLIQDGPT